MSDVEEVKNRINVVDLVGEYIRLQKAGSNWRALCPFHNEKTPSFMVSEERRSFHCFGCGKGGDIFTFVMEMEGIGFREALEQLAQKAGIQLKRNENWEARGEKGEKKKKLYDILELAAKWYEKNLWEGKGRDKILKYLRGRGLRDETIKKFRLGYAPDGWRNMLEFLPKRGYKAEEITRTGLLVEKESGIRNQESGERYYDRFRYRIMFPVQDVMGRVVGFSARVAPGGDEKTAKYINTPQTELYDKSKILYGLHLAKTEVRKQDAAVLVEGNTDVIASHQAGFGNTVAVSGTALTPEQIKIVKRYTNNLKMAYDMDSAGQAAAKRSAKICLENDLDVRIVLLPSGKDAADVLKDGKDIWKKALEKARNIVEYYFEDVFSRLNAKNPTDKKKIAREILNVVKDIADPVEKSHWLKTLSQKLDVEEKILIEVLNRAGRSEKSHQEEKPEAAERAGRAKILEKRIIGLLVAFPGETEKGKGLVREKDFSGGGEKKIFGIIAKEKKRPDFEKIIKTISDYESQKLLEEAVFEIEVEAEQRSGTVFDPADELKEALEQLRKFKSKEKIAEITKQIREAEKTGNKEAVKKLMREFQDLSEEIKG
ncbi:MAG: DNA primase [Patescibacteria group bacterium]|nr:DNA primase [Patescibacteria group bacterium]